VSAVSVEDFDDFVKKGTAKIRREFIKKGKTNVREACRKYRKYFWNWRVQRV